MKKTIKGWVFVECLNGPYATLYLNPKPSGDCVEAEFTLDLPNPKVEVWQWAARSKNFTNSYWFIADYLYTKEQVNAAFPSTSFDVVIMSGPYLVEE